MRRRIEAGKATQPHPAEMVNHALALLGEEPRAVSVRPTMPRGSKRIVEVFSSLTDDGAQVGVSTFRTPRFSLTSRRPVRGVEFIVTPEGIRTVTVRGSRRIDMHGEIRERRPNRFVSGPLSEAELPDVLSKYAGPLRAAAAQVRQGRDIRVDVFGITGERRQEVEDIRRVGDQIERLRDMSPMDTPALRVSPFVTEDSMPESRPHIVTVEFGSGDQGDRTLLHGLSGFARDWIAITTQLPEREAMHYRMRRGRVEEAEIGKKKWRRTQPQHTRALATKLATYGPEHVKVA